MQAEVLSFRPGQELMTEILSECNTLKINSTEWVLMKIHSSIAYSKERDEIKRRIKRIGFHLKYTDDPIKALELVEKLIDFMQ